MAGSPGSCVFILAAAVGLLGAFAVSAGTWFGATKGVDTNAGTSTNAPWRTIQTAANTLAPGDTVFELMPTRIHRENPFCLAGRNLPR